MRIIPVRMSIRRFMTALAVTTVLAFAGAQAVKMARVRSDALTQAGSYRVLLDGLDEMSLAVQANLDDPGGPGILAGVPDDERGPFKALIDSPQLRENVALARARWQRLADHPWELRPADLYRADDDRALRLDLPVTPPARVR